MGGKHSFIITCTISVEQKARKLLNENIYVMWITVYGFRTVCTRNFLTKRLSYSESELKHILKILFFAFDRANMLCRMFIVCFFSIFHLHIISKRITSQYFMFYTWTKHHTFWIANYIHATQIVFTGGMFLMYYNTNSNVWNGRVRKSKFVWRSILLVQDVGHAFFINRFFFV